MSARGPRPCCNHPLPSAAACLDVMPSLPMTSPAPAHRHQGAVRLGPLHVAPYPERRYQEAERPDLPLECTPLMPRDFILSHFHLAAPLPPRNRSGAEHRASYICTPPLPTHQLGAARPGLLRSPASLPAAPRPVQQVAPTPPTSSS